jgi:hypothetical protein
MDYGALWDRSSVAEPLTDKQLADAEARWQVRFPATLVAMLKAQNGGSIRRQDEVVEILPLRPDQVEHPSSFVIMSLDDYAVRGWMLMEWDLNWVRDELGDPTRVLALNSDGHVCIALNFNGPRPDEPSVCYLDFEGCVIKQIAPSLDAWLEGRAEPECVDVAVNRPGSKAPSPVSSQTPAPTPPGGLDDLEQAVTAMSSAADDLAPMMESITNTETAKALEQELLKKAEAYKAAEGRMFACINRSGMESAQLGKLLQRYQFPQTRVARVLMQLRYRGPDVYRIVRATIKLLDGI